MRRRSTLRSRRLQQQQWQRIKNIFALLLGMCLAGGGYWFIFFTPFFQIQSVTVQGFDDSVSLSVKQYLEQNTRRFIPSFLLSLFPQLGEYQMNFLAFSPSQLKILTLKRYPLLATVNFHLDIPNHLLNLSCSQREIDFRWCPDEEEKQCYFVDKEGIMFQKAPEMSGALMKTIRDKRGEKVIIGDRVLFPTQIKTLEKIFDLCQIKDAPFAISYLEINDNNFSSLRLFTSEGWFLIFSSQDDFSLVQNVVRKLEEKQLKGRMKELQYIDCRYLPKVYYRFRS